MHCRALAYALYFRRAVAIVELRKKRREYKSGERRGYDQTIAEVVQEIADVQWVSTRTRQTDYVRR
jgi:hypothetical protein